MARLLTAQPKFMTLVANIEGAGDPSKGRNPVKIRTGFSSQHICEVPRGSVATERVPDPRTPGLHTHEGLLTWTTPGVPVGASAAITVADLDFTDKAVLQIGDFTVTSGDDYEVSVGPSYVAEDITNTVPNGVIVLWKTAGAGIGEGTIDVPLHVPIEPGTFTVYWVSGAAVKSQTADAAGVFTGNGTPGGSTINHGTGALTINTTGATPDNASAITASYTSVVTDDDVATNLAAAIGGLPGFNAVAALNVVTVTGPFGPDGNEVHCSATYRGSVQNYTLVPADGFMSGAKPYLGPPVLLP